MSAVNRYFRHSKISEARFRHLVRCFALDLTATQTAAVTGISMRSVNAIFLRMRRRLAEVCELSSPFQGVVEADESYFGPRRVRGKRGRGASRKTIVFGLLGPLLVKDPDGHGHPDPPSQTANCYGRSFA